MAHDSMASLMVSSRCARYRETDCNAFERALTSQEKVRARRVVRPQSS
jgi:hypothetical protein